jgi:uncharacterized repeat protein (TIGR03943 family)
MRSTRLEALIKAILLLATGFFLYGRIANGTLYYYINERFAGFTLFGAVGLIAVGLAYHFGRKPASASAQDLAHDVGQEHSHAPATTHAHSLSWGGAFLVALPVILGLAVPAKPLGVAALDNREFNLNLESSALPASLRNVADKAAEERNILDWSRTFQKTTDYGTLVGETARVTGFVYKDPTYGADHFVLTRFVVSCCVADASVVGLMVRSQDPSLQNDQWIEVTGTFVPSDVAGWQAPVLAAESMTPVETPQQPYLYP